MKVISKLSSIVALASLFAAAPAFAGNRDGFTDGEVSRDPVAVAEENDRGEWAGMARDDGSGGDAGERASAPEVDPFDRSMDGGG